MTNFNAKMARFTIVLINHGKTMMDLDAQFKDFSLILRVDDAQNEVKRLEEKHNMRCIVLANEG